MNSAPSIDLSPLIEDYDHPPHNASGVSYDPRKETSTSCDNDAEGGAPRAPHMPTWRHPYSSTKLYFVELSGFFSATFLSWLAINNCFVSGGAFTLVMAVSLPLFKGLGIGASRQQLYMSMIMAPWAMKPFIGVASDLFPILGYNKRYFALFAVLVGLAGCSALLGISQSTGDALSAGPEAVVALTDLIVVCFTAVSYEAATLDILGEGKYAELMHLHPESGSSIISFKFGFSLLGSIAVQSFVGPLSDKGYFHTLFWISLAFSLTPLLPTLVGWIPEKRRTGDDPGMVKLCGRHLLFDRGAFLEKKAPFVVITLCGLAAPLLAAVTTYASLYFGLGFAAVLIVAFCAATYSIFPRSVSLREIIIHAHIICVVQYRKLTLYLLLSCSVLLDFLVHRSYANVVYQHRKWIGLLLHCQASAGCILTARTTFMCLILIMLPPRVYPASEACVPDGECGVRLVVRTNFTWLILMPPSLCLPYDITRCVFRAKLRLHILHYSHRDCGIPYEFILCRAVSARL